MSNIEINKKQFKELLGKDLADEKLLNDASYLGAHWHGIRDDKAEVEVYPNRPDLLSVEGLARAYKGFFGIDTGQSNYVVNDGDLSIEVHDSVKEVRPYIGGAVVREIELTESVINNLIQLQEKLHETMGRRREKLAIGLHDMSELEPDFTYTAVKPEEVSLIPLGKDKAMQLGEIVEEHEKGVEYSWILEEHNRYPVIKDSEGKVLSFPPIINNQLTEVESGTTEVFVDVTGTDKEAVSKCLNIIVTALAERGGRIDSVTIDGEEMPDLETTRMKLDPEYVRKISGLDLDKKEIGRLLEKMKYGVKYGEKIGVDIPPYRIDVMHPYDLIEDVVIAYGYSEIDPELPEVDQIGEQRDIEGFTSIIRQIMVSSGALEANTYFLSSKEKLFEMMEQEEEEIVEMKNPLTKDYSVLRNWLMPSMLDVLKNNKHHSYPQKFFEVEDVAVLDESATGSSNKRKLAYVISDDEADFNHVREILQVLGRDLGLEFEVKSSEKPFFESNRSAEIFFKGEKVGIIGELKHKVLDNWELENRVASMEIDVDKVYSLKK